MLAGWLQGFRVANFRPTVGSSLTSPKACHSLKSCSVESTPSPELKRVGGRPLLRRRNAGSMPAAFTVPRYLSVSLNLSIASEDSCRFENGELVASDQTRRLRRIVRCLRRNSATLYRLPHI